MIELEQRKEDCWIHGVQRCDLKQIFDCGQAFRFVQDGEGYTGVALGRVLHVSMQGTSLVLADTTCEEAQQKWLPYFDVERDYAAVQSHFRDDPVMQQAMDFGQGIRLLCQPAWEMVVTFLFSQRNNIPRIRSLVEGLCAVCGQKLSYRGKDYFDFPTPGQVAQAGLDALAPVRAGYRAPYVYDAACRVASGEFSLEKVAQLPTNEARQKLMELKGVGVKVADCILLFGYGRFDAFPVDVWMERAIRVLYGKQDFHPEQFGPYCGIAQQYLFYYARQNGLGKAGT